MTVNGDIISEVTRRKVSLCAVKVRLFNEGDMRTEIVNAVGLSFYHLKETIVQVRVRVLSKKRPSII